MASKTIETLVSDIEEVLLNGIMDSDDAERSLDSFLGSLRDTIKSKYFVVDRQPDRDGEESGQPRKGTLRMSNIGTPCNRKLYYSVNNPEEAAPLTPEAKMKFFFGDILEELLLFLAEVSGHKVEGRQDEVYIEGIRGRRDAIIDGVLIDVKSASTNSFKKFKNHELEKDDPFGYIDQINSYLHASESDPLITDHSRAGFLAIDKQLGHICLDFYDKSSFPYDELFRFKKDMVNMDEPPARGFHPEPDGKSGNMKLGVNCSYCDFKKKCWPSMRTFLYSNRPVHLVHVERPPNVPELT